MIMLCDTTTLIGKGMQKCKNLIKKVRFYRFQFKNENENQNHS